MTRGAQSMAPHNYRIYDRINTNGHRAYDVIERNELARTIKRLKSFSMIECIELDDGALIANETYS